MTQFLLLQLLMLLVSLSLVARVWRASALDGILCIIIPFYVIVAMIKYWGQPDHDIRWHVPLLFCGAIACVWMQYRLVNQYQAEQAALNAQLEQQAQGFADNVDDDADTDTSAALNTTSPQATIEFGPAARAERSRAAESAARIVTAEPPSPHIVSAPVDTPPPAPPTLGQALSAATFHRGLFERPSTGFAIDLPSHFHALTAIDVRRIEASRGQAPDAREIAWVLHEDVALEDPMSWHITVRWLNDGRVAPPTGPLDAERLLGDAQHHTAAPRLAGSPGELVGYAVVPEFRDGIADWVEERLPADAAASVLDCHALRLGREGVIEFSVVGVPVGSQALCDASVRLLATRARFSVAVDTTQRPGGDAKHAPYALTELIAQLR